MPEMHLKQPGCTYSAWVHLLEINKELKSLCGQEIQISCTEMSWIKLAFNMISLMANQKTDQKELNQTKFLE